MSLVLFSSTLKRNWLLLLIFFGVLVMYMGVMISMYSPESMQELTDMLKMFPKEIQDAMGLSDAINSLTTFLASWLYGMLMIGFPMVYCIILGGRLVARMVDNGSFAYLLSTPNSRTKIILTQGLYALLSVLVFFAAIFGAGVALCEASFPGELNIPIFFKLNVTTMLVNMAVMMICFFFSCLFSDAKWALGLGAGVPVAFLLMNMLGGASQDAAALKKLSLYGIYDPVLIASGESSAWQNMLFIGIVAVLFVAAVLIFKRKRLSL